MTETNKHKIILPLNIIQGNRSALLGHKWLKKLKLNWQEVYLVKEGDLGLKEILEKHSRFLTWQYKVHHS